MNAKMKIGLFFGAGAEVAYGLPSGGKFALDIFRMDSTEDKREFKSNLEAINERSFYAANWLPDNYKSRSVSTFGRRQYESLIASSLENKSKDLKEFLDNFDKQAKRKVEKFNSEGIDIDEKLKNLMGNEVGEIIFNQQITLNEALGSTKLFQSAYFSSLLQVLAKSGRKKESWVEDLKNIIRSFIELLIGAYGESFLHGINDSIFEKKPDDIDIFDDFSGYFKFDYQRVSGLDYILESRFKKLDKSLADGDSITEFARYLLEEIFSWVIDYRSLIDSHYRYLFTPKNDWAKFCKISIFLKTVRRYITQGGTETLDKIKGTDGYYQDLSKMGDVEAFAVGTSNYNNFIDEVTGIKATYLNGSIKDFYDPYRNKIIELKDGEKYDHIYVPFLFTQSGIKPLTSVSMSRRYVELFDKYSQCDVIGIIGFGFNSDDSHINGLFRELIEEKNKKVIVFSYSSEEGNIYSQRLRLSPSSKGLVVKQIDNERKCSGKIWYEALKEEI